MVFGSYASRHGYQIPSEIYSNKKIIFWVYINWLKLTQIQSEKLKKNIWNLNILYKKIKKQFMWI